ncbi:PAAR domain-containing protein [Candidatus Woesearchaeota archaeon]|nr:PAAR domain-containing protein [Candidatus Woesearchaeota archaeon]
MRAFPHKFTFALVLLVLLAGCTGSDIKDNFCGVHINFQYCKCAFHNQYCDSIGMTKSEAKAYVYAQYEAWLDEKSGNKKYGIIEKDGNLHINSKPGDVLSIKTEDLPGWARGQIATVGASIVVVGPPDIIIEGDNNVLLDGLPIARVGDGTAQGGKIVEGSKKIFVNGQPVAIIGGNTVNPIVSGGGVPYVGGPIANNAN